MTLDIINDVHITDLKSAVPQCISGCVAGLMRFYVARAIMHKRGTSSLK